MRTMRAEVLLVCWFDPAGIHTPRDMAMAIRQHSRFPVQVINLFGHAGTALPETCDPAAYRAVILHNTVTYNPETLRGLDARCPTKLRDYRGVKILLKQDENHCFREVADYMRTTGFDHVFTCLNLRDVPLIYPDMGITKFERMLTGYVMPEQRKRLPSLQGRPIDIGYRGSVQPLHFGRIAYEKQQIAALVQQGLAATDARLDISSRWEDRLEGARWQRFLSRCKAVLGVESGGSVFDLEGDLQARCAAAEAALGPYRADSEYAEAYLAYLRPLEQRIDYRQIGPRHFEAAAAGAVQLMYPGEYSGVFHAGAHYFPLARDGSNLQEALAFLRDDHARTAMAARAYQEIILNPAYGVEQFVARLDAALEQYLPGRATPRLPAYQPSCMLLAQRVWAQLPKPARQWLKPVAKRLRAG